MCENLFPPIVFALGAACFVLLWLYLRLRICHPSVSNAGFFKREYLPGANRARSPRWARARTSAASAAETSMTAVLHTNDSNNAAITTRDDDSAPFRTFRVGAFGRLLFSGTNAVSWTMSVGYLIWLYIRCCQYPGYFPYIAPMAFLVRIGLMSSECIECFNGEWTDSCEPIIVFCVHAIVMVAAFASMISTMTIGISFRTWYASCANRRRSRYQTSCGYTPMRSEIETLNRLSQLETSKLALILQVECFHTTHRHIGGKRDSPRQDATHPHIGEEYTHFNQIELRCDSSVLNVDLKHIRESLDKGQTTLPIIVTKVSCSSSVQRQLQELKSALKTACRGLDTHCRVSFVWEISTGAPQNGSDSKQPDLQTWLTDVDPAGPSCRSRFVKLLRSTIALPIVCFLSHCFFFWYTAYALLTEIVAVSVEYRVHPFTEADMLENFHRIAAVGRQPAGTHAFVPSMYM